VRFRIDAEPAELTVCDCSLCAKKNAVMTQVHESALTLLAGEDSLTEYRWNTGVARHFFCSVCGIYPFHRKRSAPDSYGVNVACLEGFDPATVPLRRADGKSMSVVGEASSTP
jgi:hypothetical protein